ncbi:MAG: carboxypeptidase regulatory-like domain-containing protein [Planctomycetes bacterium]|nr:carboxypeptidase regulatory-like domain-containing protein [Planctomycetota bacterium]
MKRFTIIAAVLLFWGRAEAQSPAAPESPSSGKVRGRLVAEGGAPISSVQVRLLRGQHSVGEAVAADDGRFTFEALPDGTYTLSVPEKVHDPTKWYRLGTPDDFFPFVRVKGAAEVDCGDINLIRYGVELCGRVVDRDEKPVVGARIFVARSDGFHWGPGETDAKGEYSLLVTPWNQGWGVTALKVLVDGNTLFVEEHAGWTAWQSHRMEVRIDRRTVRLHGRATMNEKPAEGAKVYVYQSSQKTDLTFYPPEETSAEGVYEFGTLPRGAYTVACVFPGAPTVYAETDLRDAERDKRINFHCDGPYAGGVTGRIEVIAAGRPFSGSARRLKSAELRRGVYLKILDEDRYVRPLAPAAFLEEDGDAWTFSADNLDPKAYGCRIGIVCANRPPAGLEPLASRAATASPFWMLYEAWRPLPSDPLADEISKNLIMYVQRDKPESFLCRKEFTQTDLKVLLGRRSIEFEE